MQETDFPEYCGIICKAKADIRNPLRYLLDSVKKRKTEVHHLDNIYPYRYNVCIPIGV